MPPTPRFSQGGSVAPLRVFAAVLVAVLALGVTAAIAAPPPSPLTNPGFETGDFTGWDGDSGGSGTWTINSGSHLPFSGFSAVHPAEGTYDAVFDQGEPAEGVL